MISGLSSGLQVRLVNLHWLLMLLDSMCLIVFFADSLYCPYIEEIVAKLGINWIDKIYFLIDGDRLRINRTVPTFLLIASTKQSLSLNNHHQCCLLNTVNLKWPYYAQNIKWRKSFDSCLESPCLERTFQLKVSRRCFFFSSYYRSLRLQWRFSICGKPC